MNPLKNLAFGCFSGILLRLKPASNWGSNNHFVKSISTKRDTYQVMVATDIAAYVISHVINYDVSIFAEDYVHRIGYMGLGHGFGRHNYICHV